MTPERFEEIELLSRNGRQYPKQISVESLAYALADVCCEVRCLQAEVRRLQALLDEQKRPKLDLHVDASNTLVVPGWEAPSHSFEIKSDKRPAWEYDDERRTHICHYSPRSDYRLVVSLIQTDRDYWHETQAEWLVGGSLWLGEFHDLDEAKEAAIKWAKRYEGQE